MPGQPLSNVNPNAIFSVGANVFKEHPKLMALAMQTVAAGAGIDFVLAYILTQFLRSDPKLGMAMYNALTGGEGRRAMLAAAAKARLPDEDLILFEVTLAWLTPRRDIRNSFAHHLWGYSEQVPDAALLVDPQCMIDHEVGRKLANAEMARTRTITIPPRHDLSLVRVLRENDLKEALRIVVGASSLLENLAFHLEFLEGGRISDQARSLLLQEPIIAQRYARRLEHERPHTPQ